MNKAEEALRELQEMDDLAALDSPLHRLHPLCKLITAVFYIAVTVSFPKYQLSALAVMVLFPLIGYQAAGIPVSLCFKKLKLILPLVCAVGILNPFLDRQAVMRFGSFVLTSGMISMLTLMIKGILCLMASFLLVAVTPVEGLCMALRMLHVPKILTTLFLLTFRYISVLLDEVAVMSDAYHLRAPKQKGIHISAWGSFLGQLLLRTMDRAEALYDSMLLRGYHGEFHYADIQTRTAPSVCFCLISCLLMLCARRFDIAAMLGGLFVR